MRITLTAGFMGYACKNSNISMNFKDIIKYLLLILLFSTPIYSNVPLGFKGIKGGRTFSNFYDTNSKFKQSYLYGVFGEKQITKNASLSWEAIYTAKGGIINNAPIAINTTTIYDSIYTYDIHCLVRYLEISVYLKFTFPVNKNLSIFIISGPSISFAKKDFTSIHNKKYLSTLQEYFEKDDYSQQNFTYDSGPYSTNRLDKSLRLGFNWGIGLKFNRFSIESRYSILRQDLGYLDKIYRVRLRTSTIQLILSVNIFDPEFTK